MTTAIGLLSGGIDSSLAVKIILDQNIDVICVNFVTPFCTCTRKGCKHEASSVAEKLNVPLRIISVGEEYIEMIKNPKYGYGKNMNPCIDCRIFMFKKAKELMEEVDASFIFTGEVLGQRPMSQRLNTMYLIEHEAGLEGLVVRPLSAKYLKPTIPENEGIIDREKLLSIRGRTRKPQKQLAENMGIDYRCAGGGCRLTDIQFAKRLKDAFTHEQYSMKDIIMLRYGRHFRYDNAKIIVGRNEEENKILRNLADPDDLLFEVRGCGSPITILRGEITEKNINIAGMLCARYCDLKTKKNIDVTVWNKKGMEKIITCIPANDNYVNAFLIR